MEQIIKHLFHREFSKMVAVIARMYGLSNIQIAEDVVSETFLEAAERWGIEAMRLGLLLTDYKETDQPKTNALVALMCFHTSRFEARRAAGDSMILYDQQNEELWDTALIRQGMHFLERSAKGDEISSYHLEARIAYWHCIKKDTPEKWGEILRLYDQLLKVNYSPSVALNRIYALYKVKGVQAALPEAEKLNLKGNHFYFVLMGELTGYTDPEKAKNHFEKARLLAKTQFEKQVIQEKIDGLAGVC